MQNERELRSGIIKRNTLADVPLKQYYYISRIARHNRCGLPLISLIPHQISLLSSTALPNMVRGSFAACSFV